jgi:hypothetical protein
MKKSDARRSDDILKLDSFIFQEGMGHLHLWAVPLSDSVDGKGR